MIPAKNADVPTTADADLASAVNHYGTLKETLGAITLGVLSWLMLGLLPMLLGALEDEGRMTLAQIGLAFPCLTLSMGIVSTGAGILLKRRYLRLLAGAAVVVLAGAQFAFTGASGTGVIALCIVAGGAQGVLLWIAIGAIAARTRVPARWLGIFYTSLTAALTVASAVMTAIVLPQFQSTGAFESLAAITVLGLAATLCIASQYEAVPGGEQQATGVPSLRGWMALLVALLISAAHAAVFVYLLPIAQHSGFTTTQGRTALSVFIAGQMAGGILATLAATRFNDLIVVVSAAAISCAIWGLYGAALPIWAFIAGALVWGVSLTLATPFLMPMIIRADPLKRAAALIGSAALLGNALGPFVTSRTVVSFGASSALWIGSTLMLAGVVIVLALRVSPSPSKALT